MEELLNRLLAMIQDALAEIDGMDAERMEGENEEEMRMDDEEMRSFAQEFAARVQPTLQAVTEGAQPTDEQIERVLKAHGDALFEATAERVFKAQAEKRAKREEAVRKAREAALRAEPAVSRASQIGGRVSGNDVPPQVNRVDSFRNRKFDHMSFEDMAFAHQALKQAGRNISDDFMTHMAHKVNDAIKRDATPGLSHSSVRSALPWRANELDASNITGQGQEWVGIAYSSTLWEKIRVATVYQQLQAKGMMEFEIPQGMESIYVPTEGADPTFYNVAQPNDVDATQRPQVVINQTPAGTSRQLLQPGTVGAAVTYSYILEEDSLIAVAAQFRRQLELRAQEVIENLMINGDTATAASTNINLIDGTPGSGLDAPFYITTDGFLKLPLVTTTSLSGTAGNKLSEDVYLDTFARLPKNQRANRDRLAYVVDSDTELATLKIPSVKTRDVNSAATIESGSLAKMWGIDLLVSNEMDLANTSGKISGTSSNNTRGRILCVRPDRWSFAFKRNTTFEVAEYPLSQAKTIVVTFRMGMKYFSTSGGAAVSYNVAV